MMEIVFIVVIIVVIIRSILLLDCNTVDGDKHLLSAIYRYTVCCLLFLSFRNRMKVWFCWTKSLTTWACWRGSSSVCRSENPARPSPPSQPIRTLLWAHCSSAPHFRLSHVDLGDWCLPSDREHLFRCFHFGLVFHFSEFLSVCPLSLRDGWSLRNLWRSKLKVFGSVRFVFCFFLNTFIKAIFHEKCSNLLW